MKWNEAVSLNKTFLPVCDIKNDDGLYWEQFICHDDFYSLLDNTMAMYQKREKSVWLQGTFGSGKTHATTVIKNLFSQDTLKIENYINHSIKDPRLKSTLLNFRKNSKTFPIILKGSYHISDSKSFGFAIQQEVVSALKTANIDETIANSYNDMINRMELNIDFWQNIIEKSRLIDEIDNTNELIEELNQHNSTILKLCEDELAKRGMSVITNDIIAFLEDVASIVKKYGYDNITLFWDEFTPILEVDRYNDILMMLQNLSENIKNSNVFLFIVAHRTLREDKILKDDISKVYDRFALTQYRMKEITTYALLANSLVKSNNYEEVKNSFKDQDTFNELIKYVLEQENDTVNVANVLGMLPIQPYAGLILTKIAKELKSSSRSIFSFLYDENGFNLFMDQETSFLMDITYLWDYFLEEFEKNDKLYPFLTRYETAKEIEEINSGYLVVLKAILLLNILNKVAGGDELKFHKILKPNRENLEYIFRMTPYHDLLDEALEIIGKKYIGQDVDGLFLVSSATLPEPEIFNESKRLRDGTHKNIISILKPKENDIKKLFSSGVLRTSEFDLREAKIKKHDIERYCEKFDFNYSLKVMLFFSVEKGEKLAIKNILGTLSKEHEDIIFIVVENSFGAKKYEDFINYSARNLVAIKHNHESESERSKLQSQKIVEKYINNDLKMSSITLYHKDDMRSGIAIKNISHELNLLSKKIYSSGADSSLVNGYKLWEKTKNPSKSIIQSIIKSCNRDELNQNLTGQYKPLVNLLKDNNQDYVLNEDFTIKDENSNHFLTTTIKEIEKSINKKKRSGDIDLGKSLRFLTKPPYGLYSNPISFVILSLALKMFEGKFYEIGVGKKIENHLLEDKIVEIFKSFEGKSKAELRVKFGTEEEDKLNDILKDLFCLEDGLGVVQYTFKIKEWLNQAKYPLWVAKYATDNQDIKSVIDMLTVLINAHGDDIKLTDIKEIVNLINSNSLLIDLKLLLKKERFAVYFNKFLKSLKLSIQINEYIEIYEYIKTKIRANTDSDIAGWGEDRVGMLVLEWHRDKLQNQSIASPIHSSSYNDTKSTEEASYITVEKPTIDEIKQFKNTIKYLNLSLIVMEHVDEDIELYNVLKKYIEN